MTDPQNTDPVPPPPYQGPPAPPAGAPQYPAAPSAAAAYGQEPLAVPGKTLGIVALIVVFFFNLVGLILGYVARSQSKKAGVPNTPAKVAIILGWIFLVLSIIAGIVGLVLFATVLGPVVQACAEHGPGGGQLTDGRVLTCD